MSSPSSSAGSCGLRKSSHKWDSLDAGRSSGLGEVLRYAHEPFFGSKLASQMCNLPNIVVTPASSSAVAGRGDGARVLVTEVTGSDVTPKEHAYLRYSHNFTTTGPTPHALNTHDTPIYPSTAQP